jgi:hypothetical protein
MINISVYRKALKQKSPHTTHDSMLLMVTPLCRSVHIMTVSIMLTCVNILAKPILGALVDRQFLRNALVVNMKITTSFPL